MNFHRRLTFALASILIGSAGAAYADSGDFVRQSHGVVFYYGTTNGDSDSFNFSGGPVYRVCQDAPGVSYNANHYSKLVLNKTLADETLRSVASSYADPKRCSNTYDTSSTKNYHVRVDWVGVPSAPDTNNGYGRAE